MFLEVVLPTILYIVAIVLLIVLIVAVLKVIKILDKTDRIMDNIEEKINTFNGAFAVIKSASDGISNISSTIAYRVSSAFSKVFRKFKKEDKYE